MPELMKLRRAKRRGPPELDTFAAAFAVAGEKQEMVADQETLVLLKTLLAILTLRRRARNSCVLKKVERDSIGTSMGSTSLVGSHLCALGVRFSVLI